MHKRVIVGNWKMNTTVSQAETLVRQCIDIAGDLTDVEVILAPPFLSLQVVSSLLALLPYQLAAQNVFWEDNGAYTGEISARMLHDIGCQYVIVGHSERRQLLTESNAMVNAKVRAALQHQLRPILCIGESLEDREAGRTQSVVKTQILEGLQAVDAKDFAHITLAYEPVWAIGTGYAATVEHIEEVHRFLRSTVEKQFGQSATHTRILYGGSVSADNAEELFRSPHINGALVGKACLYPESFAKIIRLASSTY